MWIFGLSAALASPPLSEPAQTNAAVAIDPESTRNVTLMERALRRNDLTACRQHAAKVLSFEDENEGHAALWMGLCWQRDGHPEDALQFFRAGLARQPFGPWTDHLEFGISETLAELGNPKQALVWLRRATRARPTHPDDEQKIAVNKALFRLQKRGISKRPTQKLLTLLDEVPTYVAVRQQARARTYLVNQWLDVADALDASDPELLRRRTVLITGAREQLDATVPLDADPLILAQIERLAKTYERLGDDVINDPAFETEKVRNVWNKARALLEVGKHHAERVELEAERATLESKEQAVVKKMERLES